MDYQNNGQEMFEGLPCKQVFSIGCVVESLNSISDIDTYGMTKELILTQLCV